MGSTADSTEIVRPTIKGIKFTFGTYQKILCQHQNQLYEAKILKCDVRDGKPSYLIHYQGWNKKWDEWVLDERIMEYNDENLKNQEEIKNAGKNSKRKSAQKRKSNVLNKSLPTDSDSQSSFKKEFDDTEESSNKKEKSSEPTTCKNIPFSFGYLFFISKTKISFFFLKFLKFQSFQRLKVLHLQDLKKTKVQRQTKNQPKILRQRRHQEAVPTPM